jgi:outer membrane autotransporter protein
MQEIQANRINCKKPTLQKLRQFLVVFAVMLLISSNSVHVTMAAPFNPTFREYLTGVCENGLFQGGSNLAQVCSDIGNVSGPVGSISSPMSPDSAGVRRLEQRLQSFRESKEEQLQKEYRRTYTMNTSERFVQGDALQLPPAGGTSPGIILDLGSSANVFLSAGAYALNHYNNRYEDGYEAHLPTVTVGADYRVNDWLLAGLALNYTNYDGTYDDGGGFDKHIFGPLLYATFMPFQGAFANVILGYARQENHNNRLATASNERTGDVFGGNTSADYSENQYTAGILAGYDQPFGNITIGPRLGLAFSHEGFESIKEDGDTGLELRYNNLNQTSVQSSLGVQASVSFETAHGIVVPQAAVAWVHEYANSDRNIDARLVEASPAAPSFTFQREPPARDWASIGLGVSAVLPNGLQPFMQFATIQGNENFVSYGGTAGVRLGL